MQLLKRTIIPVLLGCPFDRFFGNVPEKTENVPDF